MDGTAVANAAYHLQFIEYCIEQKVTAISTSLSFLNRTIIIELGSIVEILLYETLSKFYVADQKEKLKARLFVPDYATLGLLIDMSKKYKVISKPLAKKVKNLNTNRNSIHFKKFTKKYVLEHNYYTENMVEESKQIFILVLKEIRELYKDYNYSYEDVFPW